MSSVEEVRSKVSARIWQAIAQSGVEVSSIPPEQMQVLVASITDNVLVEVDGLLGAVPASQAPADALPSGGEEVVLWEGRPFLSLVEHYMVTSERIRVTRGLLGKERQDIELVRVQDIDHKQNVGERVLNLGDIIIHSHDPAQPTIILRNVTDPVEVHEIIRRAMLDARRRYRLTFQEEM
ncbi:MAG: PH domain-containing protein [Anaerolineae bacterium]|jgi:hypothetical protein